MIMKKELIIIRCIIIFIITILMIKSNLYLS